MLYGRTMEVRAQISTRQLQIFSLTAVGLQCISIVIGTVEHPVYVGGDLGHKLAHMLCSWTDLGRRAVACLNLVRPCASLAEGHA